MLEGLSVKEVMMSIPLKDDIIRLESEFYTAQTFNLKKSILGKDVIEFVQYGTSEELNEDFEGFPILRLNEFNSQFIGTPSKYCKIIDKTTFENLKLIKDDVLICRTNGNPKYVGKSALVPSNYEFAYASYLFKIRPKKEYVNSSTLVAYLNSKYGRLEIEKFSMTSNQSNFSPAKFRELRIPLFSKTFNQLIDNCYYSSFSSLGLSENNYTQAETILLQEISLQNFEPSREPVNIKNFKESFGVTKRLDAEYYQKKYEQIIDKIKSQNHNSLINIVDISKSIEPGSDNYSDEGGLPFYRVSDFNKFGLSKPDKELTDSFVADYKELIEKLKPKQGTILFSKDGSVGTAYLLRQDLDGITSGAILHLQVKNTKEIVPEYLTLALNSKLVQMQAERDAGGSIILHWRKEEIEQVVVPIINYKKQEQIAQLVEESFKLKVESEKLLEQAKKAVEMAIEENEEKAMQYIKDNM